MYYSVHMYILSDHLMCESLNGDHFTCPSVIMITFYVSSMVIDDGEAVAKEVGNRVADQKTT